MVLNRGDLDRRVVIKQKSVTNDSETNEEVITYNTLRTVWAKRLGPKSSEKFEAQQQVAVSEARYLMGYQSDLNETMILEDGGVVYKFLGIETIDRKEATMITVERRDNE